MKKKESIVNGEIERIRIIMSNARMREKLSELRLWWVLRDWVRIYQPQSEKIQIRERVLRGENTSENYWRTTKHCVIIVWMWTRAHSWAYQNGESGGCKDCDANELSSEWEAYLIWETNIEWLEPRGWGIKWNYGQGIPLKLVHMQNPWLKKAKVNERKWGKTIVSTGGVTP